MADVIDERPLSSDAAGRAPSARILVVDDDVATLGTIQRYLRQYDIDVAGCVEGALEHLDLRTYDLVLLDRLLPDGKGDTVIEEIRKRRWSVPIIMMSGQIDAELHRERQGRADDFIEKPFVREALVSKIERLLTAHAMRRQAAQTPPARSSTGSSRAASSTRRPCATSCSPPTGSPATSYSGRGPASGATAG
jgi:DNA-binding response OmpR family regulator